MQLVVLPVQFRNIGPSLASGAVDVALTVADELPAGVSRKALFSGGFVCLHDPRYARLGRRLTRKRYLAHHHVIVSYNGDLRGIIEDMLGVRRKVRVSVPTFHSVGVIVEGTALLATVPMMVAREVLRRHPKLAVTELPFAMRGTPMELVWRSALDDDDSVRFVMDHVTRIARITMVDDASAAFA